MLSETMLVLLGFMLILFMGSGGGINMGNLAIGSLLIVIGVIVALNEYSQNTPVRNSNEVTHSSKEKNTEGNHVTIEEQTTTRKVTNESSAVVA